MKLLMNGTMKMFFNLESVRVRDYLVESQQVLVKSSRDSNRLEDPFGLFDPEHILLLC